MTRSPSASGPTTSTPLLATCASATRWTFRRWRRCVQKGRTALHRPCAAAQFPVLERQSRRASIAAARDQAGGHPRVAAARRRDAVPGLRLGRAVSGPVRRVLAQLPRLRGKHRHPHQGRAHLVRGRLAGAVERWAWLSADGGGDRTVGWSGVGSRDIDHALMHNNVRDFNLAEIEGVDSSRQVIPMFGALESNRVRGDPDAVASEPSRGSCRVVSTVASSRCSGSPPWWCATSSWPPRATTPSPTSCVRSPFCATCTHAKTD